MVSWLLAAGASLAMSTGSRACRVRRGAAHGLSGGGSQASEHRCEVVVAPAAAPRHMRPSWIRDQTLSPALAGGLLTTEPPGGASWTLLTAPTINGR